MPLHHGILNGLLNAPSPATVFDHLFPVKTELNSKLESAVTFRDILDHAGEMRDVPNPDQFEF